MQEDVEHRTVAITVSAVKLTSRTLAAVLRKVGGKLEDKLMEKYHEGKTPHGKQSVKKLMNHNVATNSLPLDGDTRLFDQVARKYNVDYAFHKTGPGKYLLFFKAAQADAITACFSEYSNRVVERGKTGLSISAQIEKFAELIKSKPLERERTREAAQHER